MKKLVPLVFALTCYFFSNAQPYDPSKINKKAVDLFQKGILAAGSGKYDEAINLFNQSLAVEPKYIHAWLALGSIHGQMKNYKLSTDAYEKSFVIDSNYTAPDKFSYSINLAWQGRFEEALTAINSFLKIEKLNPNLRKNAENRKKSYEFAVDFAKKHPAGSYVFSPKNLGDAVNTIYSEYLPSLTIDGKQLIFTRKLGSEDFFYCTKKPDGSWDAAKPLEKINTPQNEGAEMISQDGQWLAFAATNRPDSRGGFDIYFSFLSPNGWSEPRNAGNRINSDQWESQPCLSPDKKDLYFSSSRFGGYGGRDIYVSHLVNGNWTEPENLGPKINSAGDEQCPFIHADNQTLYFTSGSWPGYGDDDLFYSKKQPDGKWSEPVNLGYPINTMGRDATLFIAADGKTAYYASDRSDSKGGMDIYSFELPENIRPAKTLWVRGKVFDKKTRGGLSSSVELIDLANKQTVSKIQTDDQGNYLVTLPVGKDYAFNVNRKGYLFYSDNFMLSEKSPDSTYEKNIPLQPIEINASIVLNNIFFDTKKYELDPKSQVELDKLVQLLNDNPTVKIEISGHTDNVGKPADNLSLSNNRAKSVVTYLISKGIAPQRLTAKGYGETKPVADNKTEEGKAKNRRTELRVISQ
jgi:outer membrane protein OmpA-like peptidoglycan-associated protein/tetratricopeptide (TPR) repeat protein